jgi:hypothetical protein
MKPDSSGGAGPEAAAAGRNAVENTNSANAEKTSYPSAAAPTDDELIKDIEKRVKRKDWDSAYDLLRGIQDRDLHAKTASRIDKVFAFVQEKAAAKAAAK